MIIIRVIRIIIRRINPALSIYLRNAEPAKPDIFFKFTADVCVTTTTDNDSESRIIFRATVR